MIHTTEKVISGFSTTFRQWRANSHCKYLHGYALWFKLIFEGELNECNWVIDFAAFKELKEELKYYFDHTTVIAADDPMLETFKNLAAEQLIQLRTLDSVGCEKFAEFVYNKAKNMGNLVSVTCYENENNSSTFKKN
jgi:6-pyruvoyltetrahydropterin/6-carboxytetrahydropterin synthase